MMMLNDDVFFSPGKSVMIQTATGPDRCVLEGRTYVFFLNEKGHCFPTYQGPSMRCLRNDIIDGVLKLAATQGPTTPATTTATTTKAATTIATTAPIDNKPSNSNKNNNPGNGSNNDNHHNHNHINTNDENQPQDTEYLWRANSDKMVATTANSTYVSITFCIILLFCCLFQTFWCSPPERNLNLLIQGFG